MSEQKKRATRGKTPAKTVTNSSSEQTQPAVSEQVAVAPTETVDAQTNPTVQPTANPNAVEKKQRQPRQAPFDYKGAAIAKYVDAGWHVHKYPNGSLVDFSADRDKKLHHVQVVPSDKAEDTRYSGEAKNNFITGASPYFAVPVHAKVTLVEKEGSAPTATVSFVDVNTNKKIIIAPARKKADQ